MADHLTTGATGPNRVLVATFPGQGWDFGLKRHPFHDEEMARGAKYCVYNRRLMAVSFADSTLEDEYWLLRRGAGAIHTGEHTTEVRGRDAARLLNRIFTRDIAKVRVGRCSYQLACYPDGGLIVDGVLLRLAPDRFWYVQADGDLYSWLIAHSQDLEVEIFDPGVFVSQVQGPLSLEVLAAAADAGLPEKFRYFDSARIAMGGQPVLVSRTGYTNELGWEFYTEPTTDSTALWAHIKAAGAPFGMGLVGLDAFDPRRIEAGIENAGSDFDHTTTPYAVGLGDFVDPGKADFIGKAALEAADKRSRLFGLQCEGGTPATLGAVSRDGGRVGVMTAGAWSPTLRRGIGFVRLDEAGLEPGAAVSVACLDGQTRPASLCSLPMYDAERKIPRGLDTTIPERP